MPVEVLPREGGQTRRRFRRCRGWIGGSRIDVRGRRPSEQHSVAGLPVRDYRQSCRRKEGAGAGRLGICFHVFGPCQRCVDGTLSWLIIISRQRRRNPLGGTYRSHPSTVPGSNQRRAGVGELRFGISVGRGSAAACQVHQLEGVCLHSDGLRHGSPSARCRQPAVEHKGSPNARRVPQAMAHLSCHVRRSYARPVLSEACRRGHPQVADEQ
mmetsp:Transcript_2922/g.8197  ORF Transcript_2922/g.8197 Transcript_2922/m.8197 type:complete len:212 (+) Transcript_2922:2044-2679(+)